MKYGITRSSAALAKTHDSTREDDGAAGTTPGAGLVPAWSTQSGSVPGVALAGVAFNGAVGVGGGAANDDVGAAATGVVGGVAGAFALLVGSTVGSAIALGAWVWRGRGVTPWLSACESVL